MDGSADTRRTVQILHTHQVESVSRVPGRQIFTQPGDSVGDTGILGGHFPAFQGGRREIDCGYPPAVPGQPDRIGSLAGSEVQGRARRKVTHCLDQPLIGLT